MNYTASSFAERVNKQTLLRYQLIEIIAYWEGRITTKHLCDAFGIGRQQASRDINAYLKDFVADNLEYDMQLRGYKPTEQFRPLFTQGHINEYLQLLAWNQSSVSKNSLSVSALGLREITTVTPPPRLIKPQIMRAIVRAIGEGRRIDIDYLSMDASEPEGRIIAPHSLIETPLRWHVRAYCEKNRDYRDFVLSRFVNEPEILDFSPNPREQDEAWCTPVNLILQADPLLNQHQKTVIETDYNMVEGELIIPTRIALIHYLANSLGLNMSEEVGHSTQQICIKNKEQLCQALRTNKD